MPLRLHLSPSGGALQQALAGVLAQPLPDPFQSEVIAVPAKGVERWLAQELSTSLGVGGAADGVCANVVFPSPATLLDEAASSAHAPMAAAVEAWAPGVTTWHLVELLRGLPADPAFEALERYLSRGRLYATASKLAGLFARYDNDRRGDVAFPPDLQWQAKLLAALQTRVGVPRPAELHGAALAALRSDPSRVPLPSRLSVFGLSRISKARLDVLVALAEARDVHLFVHHPGAALWEAIGTSAVLRADDTSAAALTNPLLVSLSRDVRELQQRLVGATSVEVTVHDVPAPSDRLLHRLQRSLVTDGAVSGRGDRSVQVHACHGQARQVEVLREAVLQILASDPMLEPRDVLVMCPDVETYAPLVKAVFDTDSHPGGRLRVSIADRSPRQTNPLLGLASKVLTLAGSRVTGAQVLDLAGAPAVRQRFGFGDDDVEQLRAWTMEANVHWGLDAGHREPWKLGRMTDGTWEGGLDRVLAGVAMGGRVEPWSGTMPLGGIDSTDIDLTGRFAELVDRLRAALVRFRAATTVGSWLDALQQAVEELGDVPRYTGEWQTVQLARELDELRTASAGSTAVLTLTDVQTLLEERLAGRPTRTSFRTGGMTVCTLTPMRSVPHKVICLLGMDDNAFPRHGIPDGDDVLARAPRLGERDPRSEDRQLFLDALLAARQHLVITYNGADVRTGAHLPPAVPVGELLDALGDARHDVVVRHPLQPFDAVNFADGALGADGPFSFDTSAFAGAKATLVEPVPPPPFLDDVLPVPTERSVTLRQLSEFFENPAKAFLRQRLGVLATSRDEQPSDAMPLELDNLQEWTVGDRMLKALLRGDSPDQVIAAVRSRGELPPGALGVDVLTTVGPRVQTLVNTAAPYRVGDATAVDVNLSVGGWDVTGAVTGVHASTLLHITYSNLKAKQQLRAWVELLALTATQPGDWQAVVVGRDRDKAKVRTLGPLSANDARQHLADLVALREIGLRTPLPIPVATSSAYALKRLGLNDVDQSRDEAYKAWTSDWGYPKEDRETENLVVWGEVPFRALWGWRSPVPLPDGHGIEPNDFARLSMRVWQPLMDAS
ncbi:MAG: exodeoxyribonuclease gamma subunit [Frankiales bacterium]|nr:exodeoxyribonuclease gamma subunit [Frankiales bacterium]